MLVEEFLSRHEVAFEAIDIRELDDSMAVLRSVTGGPVGTPTVVIGDEVRLGYDEDWMREKLGL